MNSTRPSVLTVFFSLFCTLLIAQNTLISGKVLEGQGGVPVEYATIKLLDDQSSMIDGTTTDFEGKFMMKVGTVPSVIEVSFIGFETKRISDFSASGNQINLGEIFLGSDAEVLEEVVVRAERSTTEFKLDKRVFNVGQDLSNSGAGALEVLNNVPSVNVNIEGEISLRGKSGVQILINGKPSVLSSDGSNALGSLTAEMIEQIEVITNPSAKYDAEGTSGIINIVLKKDERKGMNGSVSVNTGIPDNHSIGFSLNKRTEKFNLFTQLGAGYRSLPRENKNINTNLVSNNTIKSEGTSYRNEQFYNIRLGTDYYIDRHNIITLSGNFAYEVEDQPSETNFEQLTGTKISREWTRTEETEATNPKWQYELQYKREFTDDEDHTLLFSAIGSLFAKDQSSDFQNEYKRDGYPIEYQKTATNFKESKYTLNLDYTKPLNEVFTIETGAQYVLQNVSNDFAVTDLVDDVWIPNAGLTNVFDYDQDVIGAYGTASYEGDKWGVKVGGRYEYTDLKTTLETTGEKNDQLYGNFFPSFHTSYKISPSVSMQAGYSKRIFRPRLWDLNPFFNIRNNFNIWAGNPELQPEFTDAYEVTSIFLFDDITFNLGVYQLYTTDVVERFQIFEENVSIQKPLNIGTNRATGIEFNFKYSPIKKLTLTGDLNYNYFIRKGEFEDQNFDFNGDRLNAKSTLKLKLPHDFDVEMTGHFHSKYKTVQTVQAQNIFADLGIRKKFAKGRTIVSLSVRDIFKGRFRENEISHDDYYLYSWGRRGRFVSLGVSYGFGKGEAMEYSGRHRH